MLAFGYSMGWWAFALSNLAWILSAARTRNWPLFFQMAVFAVTSAIGIVKNWSAIATF